MQKNKVLIIAAYGISGCGGICRMMSYMIDAWQTMDDAPSYQVIDPRGSGRLLWAPYHFFKAVVQISQQVLLKGATTVHVNMAAYGSIVRKLLVVGLCRVLNVTVILHLHSGAFSKFYSSLPEPAKAAVRFGISRATRIVVVGKTWQEYLCDTVGVDPRKVVIMRNAVPIPDKCCLERHLGHTFRILFLGQIVKTKGVWDLLEALASDGIRALPWRALFAGSGDVMECRRRLAELNLADRVELPGMVEPAGVTQLLQQSHILVLPSHHEGLPMAVLEAMAYGLVVIATPVGATPEVIANDHNGLLVPPRDTSALGEALARVMLDKHLRARLSGAAREHAVKELNVESYARRMIALYNGSPARLVSD